MKRFYVGRFDDTGWAVYDRTGQERPVQTMGLDDGDQLAEEKNLAAENAEHFTVGAGWCTCGVGEYQPPEVHATTCVGALKSRESEKRVALDDQELDILLNWYGSSHSTGNPEWDEEQDDLADKLKAARRW